MKALIIDDEQYIREGLKSLIDWNSLGFEIAGEAKNGKEGLMKIKELHPEVCVVDIRMPVMDGIKMIEQASQEKIKCKFIILSGYRDFEYAQRAMECNVNKYVLKPIDEDQLVEKLQEVRDEIIKTNAQLRYVEESTNLSKDKVIHKIIMQKSPSIMWMNQWYNFQLPWNSYHIVLIDFLEDVTTVKKAMARKILEEFIKNGDYGVVFQIEEYVGIVIKNILFEHNFLLLEKMKILLKQEVLIDTIIAVGRKVKDINDIYLSFTDAKMLLKHSFIYGDEKILSSGLLDKRREVELETDNFDIDVYTDNLYAAIDVNSMKSINDILEDMLDNYKILGWSSEKIKAYYVNLYVKITTILFEKNKELKNMELLNERILEKLYTQGSLIKLHGFVKYQLVTISDILSAKRPTEIIHKIINYVERNYDKEIKIDDLGKIFNYNSAYLGKQFKNQTGNYFNTFLDQVRINNAKKLLVNTDYKIYEIAKKVGYKEPDYFTIKFKKYVDQSPNAYRNSKKGER
ncbi:DNA-binding response regulator [Vallitalea longa]|uniref:Stage 0 sporulation protein A homolog n=1 Tax=Vallitalea longa TaxID=2936439 RepID=A0A9W5YGC1_9FIRM|nr:response regulator [Vallitalea longa]GKX31793.1 DNA-binding response regulator [Vallitalea longa]